MFPKIAGQSDFNGAMNTLIVAKGIFDTPEVKNLIENEKENIKS